MESVVVSAKSVRQLILWPTAGAGLVAVDSDPSYPVFSELCKVAMLSLCLVVDVLSLYVAHVFTKSLACADVCDGVIRCLGYDVM